MQFSINSPGYFSLYHFYGPLIDIFKCSVPLFSKVLEGVYVIEHLAESLDFFKLFENSVVIWYISTLSEYYTEQKKLRKYLKTMQHTNTKANNYSFFIYLIRYMSSVEKHVYFKLLAPMPLF